ncbi:tyrosine-type recombinase/integrase [Streptomyces chrestomyceticus]|uniref:tyrosine-type recombinase/integrase n=1 Tax=Streptomyces chrestomyceticus TaxID=68185 RepID=UPI0033EE4B7B
MTATLTASPALPRPLPDLAEKYADLVDPAFLVEIGWDADRLVLTPPPDHLQVGTPACVVAECEAPRTRTGGLCVACCYRQRKSGMPLEEFVARPRRGRRTGVDPCAVTDCPRPWKTSREPICDAHSYQRKEIYRLSLEEFLRHPEVVPLPSFGPCMVASCTRDSVGARTSYCRTHAARFRAARATEGFDEQRWRRVESSIPEANTVSFRGLPPLVVNELLFGIQQRTRSGAKTRMDLLRQICDGLRAQQVGSLLDHEPLSSHGTRVLVEHFARHVRRALLSPETEVLKDVWDMWVFGHQGTLDFRGISQRWLREAAKRWAADDIPHRRGNGVRGSTQTKIKHLERLSASLRAYREDRGEHPAVLGRRDIERHLQRLTFLNSQGELSDYARTKTCRELKWLLREMRALGLTHAGEPMAGLPEKFALTTRDVPEEPEDKDEAGRDLPTDVMRFLCSNLDSLGETSPTVRVAVELIIDTGRRPDEICQLDWDCLAQDPGGKHVLIYNNIKSNRERRRLPIPDATAALILQQKQAVRERFPDADLSTLKLLPSPKTNPYGRKAFTSTWLGDVHRDWVDGLPDIMVTATMEVDGKPVTTLVEFDKSKIFPYAYRHTYAQRHADAGVGIDVLCELMDHDQLDTTRGYFRVGQERRRSAVDKVAVMQFDRHGNRVWREAEELLDSERLRNGLGEAQVPFGRCSEPTNVQAGGGQCPIRFRCLGCDHFNSDVSYLPDLEGYLADLLRNRERIASMAAADEWAKVEAMPSQEEIARVRQLIRKVKEELDTLSSEDREQIQEAVRLVRRTRQVMLGMPSVRQPLSDVRPERSA